IHYEVITIAFENWMRRYIYFYIQVAGSALPNRLAIASHADHLSIANSRWNNNRNFFFAAEHTFAFTGLANFFLNFTCAQTSLANFRAGNISKNSSLGFTNLTLTVAGLARDHGIAGFSTRTMTSETAGSFGD